MGATFEHAAHGAEGLVHQRHAGGEHLLGFGEKLLVARDVGRVEPTDLAQHLIALTVVVKHAPIFEPHIVERVDRHDLHVVARLRTSRREDVIDHPRCGDDRGTGVELKSIALKDIRATPGLVELLDDRDLMSLRLQPDCG